MPTVQALVTQSYLSDIADAIRAKNGAVTTYTPAQMAAAISAIPSGGSSETARYTLDNNGEATARSGALSVPDIVTITDYALSHAFYTDTLIISVIFDDLTSIADHGLQYSFYGDTNLTSASFPELVTVGPSGLFYAFGNCASLTSCTFPELTTVDALACHRLFSNCSSLVSISFPKLVNINNNAFSTGMLLGCSSLTSIHFKSSVQSTIEQMNGYSNLWGRGSGNATIYYDL